MGKEMQHMRNRILAALAALALVAGIAAESRAQSAAGPGLDKDAIEGIVRDYLLRNPEVIEEAIGLLRAKQQAEKQARSRAAIRENGEVLRAHPMSPVSGNADGDVTVVEFFDYQCGYCKRALPVMEALLERTRMCVSCGRSSRSWAPSRSSPPAPRWLRSARAGTCRSIWR